MCSGRPYFSDPDWGVSGCGGRLFFLIPTLSPTALYSSPNVNTISSQASNVTLFEPITDAISISSSLGSDDPMLWSYISGIENQRSGLNDGIIYAAQSMACAKTEGKFFGWQSIQCSRRGGLFSEVPPFSPLIQLFHTGNCHWTNVNVHDGTCY